MKKALPIILFVVIAGAAAGAFAYIRNPTRMACVRVGDLCGVQGGTASDLDQCVDNVKQWRKIAGDDAVDKGVACVEKANTCGEAMGCMAGAGFKGLEGVMNDFMKGFGNAIK